MEPKSSANSHEQLPAPIEFTPAPPDAEHMSRQNVERRETSPETGQEQHRENTATPQPTVLPTPIAAPQPVADPQQPVAVSADDSPAIAADEDLIEKEWVDKAKKIVVESRDDPYKREREVGKLQSDYLRKRYGKELGSST